MATNASIKEYMKAVLEMVFLYVKKINVKQLSCKKEI